MEVFWRKVITMKFLHGLFSSKSEFKPHPSNSQPHPAIEHLKITVKANEYMDAEKTVISWEWEYDPFDFVQKLPNYIIARCPLCNSEYKAVLDTHSLKTWGTIPELDNAVFSAKHQEIGCNHFVAVHSFVNLNGIFPKEQSRYFRNEYDVPFISPLFVPDDVPAYAVMHSLPICRIEDEQFIPRYALYTLTYYAPEEYIHWEPRSSTKSLVRRGILHERRSAEHKGEWEGFLYGLWDARQHPDWWDLPLWVKKGKLLWLDPYSSNLELKNGPVEDFPYVNIQGYRRGIEIRNGKFRFTD
jgi:hypothetical protein